MRDARLYGPYLGELSWEFYRFAPFVIYNKIRYPFIKTIILTRPSRFDLYGSYADIFVPLKMKDENEDLQEGHGMKGFDLKLYDRLVRNFHMRFSGRFNILSHQYPDIREWFRKVKWQFPRINMDYSFKPREDNTRMINTLVDEYENIIFCDIDHNIRPKNYKVFDKSFYGQIFDKANINTTFLGCLIEILKRCKFTIGNIENPISHLSLLLKIPLIHVGDDLREDTVKMLNPLETPVIKCNNHYKGIEIYESHF
jgi:hypothetical protein